MALYVLENFKWDQREVTFAPLPLSDYNQDMCLNFNLAKAEEAAKDFLLPKIHEVVFCAIRHNNAVRLGVLSRGMIEILESPLLSCGEHL